MSTPSVPVFILNLARICRQNLLAEKWLLAPSRRVGRQWVERMARMGQPVVNLRVVTVRGLVLGLSGSAPGRLVSVRCSEVLVSKVLDELRERGERYFTTLEPFPSLISALARSVEDLRVAGVKPADLRRSGRDSPKMSELADLLAGYQDGLDGMDRLDYAGVLSSVVRAFTDGEGSWPKERMLLRPDDLVLRGLEGPLIGLLPATTVPGLLPGPRRPPKDGLPTDLELLAWPDAPMDAPPPAGDGSVTILGAAGEVNEVRMVLRRCLAQGWALDEVEILYTDSSTYLPLLFELFARHFGFVSGSFEDLPVTFSEGVPSRYSRPGRALAAWARWAMDGYPARGIAGLVREGLLKLDGEESLKSRSEAADLLIRLSAGNGPGAVLDAVQREIQAKERCEKRYDEHGEEMPLEVEDLPVLRILESLLYSLSKCTPLAGQSLPEVLASAGCFLSEVARRAGEFDEYAATALKQDIAETRRLLDELFHCPGGDPLSWIVSFVDGTRVAGSGPRPGRLHAAPLGQGGHTGRPHTVVLGMDDRRHPGSDRQEPVLLDREREALSGLLALSVDEFRRREASLPSLAAGLRGTLTMTCSLRDLLEDRDTFPSPALARSYRTLHDRGADHEALISALSPPAGFVDPNGGAFLDSAEWWVERLTRPVTVSDGWAAIARRFPHLGRGAAAWAERRRTSVTPFDGLTGRLPPEMDILSGTGPVVSANRLQTLGTCPLRYFFEYVLGVKRLEPEPPEPGRWLSPGERGVILHRLFHLYLDRIIREGRAPDPDLDGTFLERTLDGLLDRHAAVVPPPSTHAMEHERAEMQESARIFLREEESFAVDHEPLYAEASLGLAPTEMPSGLDRRQPVNVDLGQGRRIRVRGRIDRIDRRRGDGAFVVTDYKSGSNRLYSGPDPFAGGRVVQHALYTLLAETCLRETFGPAAHVAAFRFLFPTFQAQGESVVLSRDDLAGGKEMLSALCDIAGDGCFVPTDDPGDCAWCDYSLICGDIDAQAARVAGKLDSDDPRLDPMRKLRGHGQG